MSSDAKTLLEGLTCTAIAVEALESLLVEKGILADNAVLERMKVLMVEKSAQIDAGATSKGDSPRIITPV